VGANVGDGVCVSVWHLTSYEYMGRAHIRCSHGCTCESHYIQAHAVESWRGRNASLYKEHRVHARVREVAPRACVVELRVDEYTASGGHKFRVSDVQLQKASSAGGQQPCSTGVRKHGEAGGVEWRP